jgi:hypothetical protein
MVEGTVYDDYRSWRGRRKLKGGNADLPAFLQILFSFKVGIRSIHLSLSTGYAVQAVTVRAIC